MAHLGVGRCDVVFSTTQPHFRVLGLRVPASLDQGEGVPQ